jgi:TRAP-type C4-dicarboxylate transport system permease small subunit
MESKLKLRSFLKQLLDILKRLDVAVVTLLMLGIFLNILLQITSRLTPGRIVHWTVEMGGDILLPAVIWLGIGAGVISNAHVRFDIVLSKLPHKTKKNFYAVGNIIFAAFLIMLAYYTIDMLSAAIRFNNRTPALRWSRALIRAPVLIGCVIGALRLLIQAWFFVAEKEPLPSSEADEAISLATEAVEEK